MESPKKNVLASVCFAKTPLVKIGSKIAQILDLGWEETNRADPWLAALSKDFPENSDPIAELRDVMGEYWMTADDIRAFAESLGIERRRKLRARDRSE